MIALRLLRAYYKANVKVFDWLLARTYRLDLTAIDLVLGLLAITGTIIAVAEAIRLLGR